MFFREVEIQVLIYCILKTLIMTLLISSFSHSTKHWRILKRLSPKEVVVLFQVSRVQIPCQLHCFLLFSMLGYIRCNVLYFIAIRCSEEKQRIEFVLQLSPSFSQTIWNMSRLLSKLQVVSLNNQSTKAESSQCNMPGFRLTLFTNIARDNHLKQALFNFHEAIWHLSVSPNTNLVCPSLAGWCKTDQLVMQIHIQHGPVQSLLYYLKALLTWPVWNEGR